LRYGSVVVVDVAVVISGVGIDVVCVVGFGRVGNGVVGYVADGKACDGDGVGNGVRSRREKRKRSRKRVKRGHRNEWYGNWRGKGIGWRNWTG